MDKKNFNFFNFVYRIMRFIFLLPINLVKYFCVGFYHVCFVLIDIVLSTIKYFVLFFTFPVVIYNILHRSKKSNEDIQNIVGGEINNSTDYNESNMVSITNNNVTKIDPIIDVDKVLNYREESDTLQGNFLNEQTIQLNSINMNNENNEFENVDSGVNNSVVKGPGINVINESITELPKTVKTANSNLFSKIFHGLYLSLYVLCFPVYKIFKYFVFGIGAIFFILNKIFIYISFVVYKIVKYLLFSLGLPIMLINVFARIGNSELREAARLRREEEKFNKQLMYQQKQEEKLRLALEKKKKREKETEEYINENVKIEKKTFSQKFNEFLNKLFALPGVLINRIKKSYHNSVFVKNSRNKRDINRQALLIDFEGKDAEKSDVKLVYQYTAKNAEGKIVTDYFEAFSKVEVHSFLLSEGYEVYNIKTNKWIQFAHSGSSTSKTKLKNKDLIFFLNQLSTYIKAGIPLVEALKILARQYNKQKNYQKMFRTIIYDLSMGESFSSALSKQGNAFPRILINMVKASELTGELPEVLDDMSEYFTEMDKTRKQMVTALMYPIIILVISIVVVTFILLFVIPGFVSIYESMDAASIPKFTLIVLAVSDFLKNNILYLVIGIALLILVLIYLYKNVKAFRTIAQWVFMHTPVFGNVIIYNEVTTFTKTFSSLLAHNVFITDSMEILNKVTNNEIYKMLILDTITNLAKGEKISTSFKDHWAFPVPAYEMLVTGERTGQLPEMMAKVSSYYQELHRNAVTRIKTFIEPILIVFLTLIVGVIVLAIVIPMFGMYESIQNYD